MGRRGIAGRAEVRDLPLEWDEPFALVPEEDVSEVVYLLRHGLPIDRRAPVDAPVRLPKPVAAKPRVRTPPKPVRLTGEALVAALREEVSALTRELAWLASPNHGNAPGVARNVALACAERLGVVTREILRVQT